MVSRAVHHEDGGRERSGYADSRRDDPQPDGGGDGDTPVAQGGATPAAGRQEREAGRLELGNTPAGCRLSKYPMPKGAFINTLVITA